MLKTVVKGITTDGETQPSTPIEQAFAQMTGGKKYDGDKPDLSIVPRSALEGMARAFMVGEKKYGRYNFTKGFASHRLISACLRHVVAWQDGESLDPETGNHHLWHALASLAMLLECERLGTLEDTRRGNVD
jgi:hypothetical protein